MDTGGDVNAKHRFPTFVDQFNDIAIQSFDISCDACAQNGIHDGIAMGNVRFYRFDGFNPLDFYRQPGHNIEVDFGRALEFTPVA
jgi:hypothetical protein